MDDAADRDEPARIRVTDEERARTTRRLTEAVGEGRLTLDEFSERSRRAYECAGRDELEALTGDLPSPPNESEVDTTGRPPGKRNWTIAVLGGSDYGGRRRFPARTGFLAFLGGSDIDLRHAVLPAQDVEITMLSIMGGNDLIVPRGVRVEVNGTAVLGGDDVHIDEDAVPADSPTVRVRTFSFMGGNDVRHPKPSRHDR